MIGDCLDHTLCGGIAEPPHHFVLYMLHVSMVMVGTGSFLVLIQFAFLVTVVGYLVVLLVLLLLLLFGNCKL